MGQFSLFFEVVKRGAKKLDLDLFIFVLYGAGKESFSMHVSWKNDNNLSAADISK